MASNDFPIAYLRDEWTPTYAWRRGAKLVAHVERNWMYLSDIRRASVSARRWIAAGHSAKAETLARAAAHYAILYLKGEW